MKSFNRKKMQGFALGELILALVVVGVLVAIAYPRMAKSMASSKGQALGTDVVAVAADLQAAYNGKYAEISDAKLISGSILKNVGAITDNDGTLTTNMGGTISFAPSRLVANNDSFSATVTNVKDGACIALATTLGRSAVKLSIAGTVVKAPGLAMDASKITCSDDNTSFVAIFS